LGTRPRSGKRPLQPGEEAGERGPLVRRERPDQVRLVLEELADRALDEGMAGGNTDFTRPPSQGADLADLAAAGRANLDANLISANLISAVLTTAAVRPALRPGGTIINVGSIGAEYASTSYGAAKAALAARTAGLSAEVGPQGLTANLISPGYIAGTGFFRGRLTGEREPR
jgi:3-oxoacyl-[acyl-carrier protein] reductase